MQNESEMEALGRKLAKNFQAGTIVALAGDLGVGKTRLVKGLAAGLGHQGEVTSPTFALMNEYLGGRLPLFHLDLYRLATVEELLGIGWDELLDEPGVVVAEWADRFPEIFPNSTLQLRIDREGNEARRVQQI